MRELIQSCQITKCNSPTRMNNPLTEYFRCPDQFAIFRQEEHPEDACGYFRFGNGVTCYGSYRDSRPSPANVDDLPDALADAEIKDGHVVLPFSPLEVIGNLQRELYVQNWRHGALSHLADLYYLIRPALPVAVRRHLQKLHLRNWSKLTFPRWPIDCSVDNLLEQILLLTLKTSRTERIPFIWFWPEGHAGCAVMTHDVETRKGSDFCPALMDIDDSFGIKSSFQIIPEDRYLVRPEFLHAIRSRGFEICVHDLNHDGHLFKDREQFLARAKQINHYGVQFQAEGFRAAVLYRKQLWFDALKFSFDMSVPNVAHLDPQRGGCCTVMPFFVGNILEIPVTAVQDYTLFHILNDYSIDLWKEQIELILNKHGCLNFIVHPDYVIEEAEQSVYRQLLEHLNQVGRERNVWTTTPAQVNRWWRERAAMNLVESEEGWRIEGPGKERARIAYATEKDGHLVFSIEGETDPKPITSQNGLYPSSSNVSDAAATQAIRRS
jgi:hypothetical protein